MNFVHRIGEMGFDIVKTVTLNASVADLAVHDIWIASIDPLNPVNLAIHSPKSISSDIKARNRMPSAMRVDRNIGNQSAVSPNKKTLLVIDSADQPNPT